MASAGINNVSEGALRQFIDRLEHMEEAKADVNDKVKVILAEAKSDGFNAKVLKKIISDRKIAKEKRLEEESLLDLYRSVLGE